MTKLNVGDKVTANKIITEGGGDVDLNATFPMKSYVHALPGDVGEVIHLQEEGLPTVRFERTGTATIVGLDEVH